MAALTNSYADYDQRTLDDATKFGTTPATVTTSAAFGSAVTVGAARMFFDVLIDLSTVLATAGNGHIICVQGSNDAFSTPINLAYWVVGDTTLIGQADDAGDERVLIRCCNFREGTTYTAVRVYLVQVSSGSTIVNQAFLVPSSR